MKFSHLFTKTRKEAPKDEVSRNGQLLIQAGFVHKEMAGVYTYLPLGLRVLRKVENIIREEMDAIGGQEIDMTVLQDKELWEKTGRWSDDFVDNWFKTKLKNETELGLGLTHEEPLSNIMTQFVDSYKDLPVYPYQIQVKFRNELRAKSGIMRGREFLMKDLYSFNKTTEEQDAFYEKVQGAYDKIYDRCGIGDKTYMTFASGGIFSKYSHEYQTVNEAGEDTIYIDEEKNLAINKEVFSDEVLAELGVDKDRVVEKKAIEVGNIFKQGTKYTEPLNLFFTDEDGNKQPVYLGAYGIGVGRLMGTIVEVLSDDKGMVWPEEVAPAKVHLVALDGGFDEADKLYEQLQEYGTEVLYDDREDAAAGKKLADADLMGCPWRLVVSKKSLENGGVEVKQRTVDNSEIVPLTNVSKVIN